MLSGPTPSSSGGWIAPLHPAWCCPASHEHVGPRDTWHRSEVQSVEPVSSMPGDPDRVDVLVEQYASRDHVAAEWRSGVAGIVLGVLREGGAQLSATEARWVARLLLAAADIADGVAVTW